MLNSVITLHYKGSSVMCVADRKKQTRNKLSIFILHLQSADISQCGGEDNGGDTDVTFNVTAQKDKSTTVA